MQAIHTTYKAPTDTRGSKIIAKCDAKKIILSWDYDLGVEDNHRAAAEELVRRLEWNTPNYGRLISGALPNQGGYAHVMTGKE